MTNNVRIKQSLLTQAFDLAPIGTALVALDGSWLKANKSLCAMLGYDEEELLQLNFQMLTHPEDLAMDIALTHELLKGSRDTFQLEKRYLHKLGHHVWAHLTASIVRDEEGLPLFFISHIQDITGRKHAEAREQRQSELLTQQEKAFELITENALDIISYSDPSGVFLYISPSVRTLLGYAREEFIGTVAHSYIHPDDLKEMEARPFTDEHSLTYRVRHKQGHYVWFETNGKLKYGKDGRLEKILSISRDITERKTLEEALRKSEENLKLAQKIARIGSYDWDIAHDDIAWSDEMYALFEIEPSEVVRKYQPVIKLFHPDDQERIHKAVQDAFSGKELSLICRHIGKTGSVKHLHLQGIVTFDNQGQPVKMNGTIQDISERIQSKTKLEESVERFTSLLENNPDAIFELNLHGRFLSVNKAAEQITGYTAEEMKGMHYSHLVCEEMMKPALERFQAGLTGQSVDDTPLIIRNKQGQRIHIIITPAPIIIHNRIAGCYIIARDVTDQKKKDELLITSEKQTIAGQLAAAIAHEIRNPLTAIKGFLKLMSASMTKQEYIDIISEEFSRIEMITNELLLLAKPQAAKMADQDMLHILNNVITLLETQANMNNVSLIKDFHIDSSLRIRCDENQIKQVMINILKNAIEAMSKGGEVVISAKLEAGHAVIGITDQGCGIPGDIIAKIGQPFYSTKDKGTGLGLMVSYKIVENHSGKVVVKSEEGKGTTFEVLLPVICMLEDM